MTVVSYQLPNGSAPVLVSSDTPELLRGEAAALLSYAADHPEVPPQEIAGMLFRTRIARKHRALAMVTNRRELLSALQAVIDDSEHPAVVRTDTPAAARRFAHVFPGQGGQRPGMGRLFYDSVPTFRAEADRCAAEFQTQFGLSPLNYLLDEHLSTDDSAGTVQPALFTQMAGLSAVWRSFGIAPRVTIGHSQGEIAAAYVSGLITLADAVRIIGIRAHAADEIASGDYAMAVVAADRDTCEELLARRSGWAELSVINSPNVSGISGDRETVQAIVDTLTERGAFARVIRVAYPAHTSLINEFGDKVRTATQRELRNPKFLDADIDCLGATLGGPITSDLLVDQYWFWNLRNTVRFDKAVAAALQMGVDTFVELAEHPTLQLAIQENVDVLNVDDEPTTMVVGTSNRTAINLDEFTRNLAQLAVHDLDYSWDHLSAESTGPVPLPLADFPNTRMNETFLWLPYDEVLPRRARQASTSVIATTEPVRTAAPPRLLTEEWFRLSRRSLLPPRAIGIIDHTRACAGLADALCAAAADLGATVRVIDIVNTRATDDLNTLAILVPESPKLDAVEAAAEVATFFGDRVWWPGVDGGITDCWLVTVSSEAVVGEDAPPDLVHAAASAGFRSIGAEYPGVRFRHLDLPAGSTSEAATTILAALHTAEESELAVRSGGLYAKRVVDADTSVADPDRSIETPPEHVLIVGGTGKLGLEFCDHFARRGAGRITLVSRSGETAAVADRLAGIRSATSTQIGVVRCDVGDQAAIAELAEQHHHTPADLIIHAAVQYSGVELQDVTAEMVDEALRAKVVGISRVLATFPRTDHCRVVLCSSISATVGGRGLALYAASNRVLDALAYRYRSEGLDCASVQWGLWKVDLDRSGIEMWAGIGVVPMLPADALTVGMRIPVRSNAIVASFDLDRARSVLETCGRGSLLSQLSAAQPTLIDPADSCRAAEVPVEAQDTGRSHRLVRLLAGAIGVDRVDTIDTTVPMVAIGLDSLQALELRRRVKMEFDHDLEVSDLLGGASIADVLAKLGG
ncbi:nocobactin polyketide synthase NbtC [Mycobacterium riyadhense]|uniref:Polyketide synthase n=1 Tax=Mycobacterium riyadhense TaxID=486698 RepID=A0A1X2BQA3_9MYCO|nr:nocobactin polyketide synthase NbtC [Mycobacterium riyadhense]ORW65855.1 polyketide synthase [Mycobacterium riyadhense]